MLSMRGIPGEADLGTSRTFVGAGSQWHPPGGSGAVAAVAGAVANAVPDRQESPEAPTTPGRVRVTRKTSYYITTAIDYSNGEPHLGHAYEKIGADCVARYRRLCGDSVQFVIGMDEHGQKVAQTADAWAFSVVVDGVTIDSSVALETGASDIEGSTPSRVFDWPGKPTQSTPPPKLNHLNLNPPQPPPNTT